MSHSGDLATSSSYRFAISPKWISGHVLALVAIVTFVNCGFWQLRRHEEKAVSNTLRQERMATPQQDLLAAIATFGEDPQKLEFRRVEVSGIYLVEEEVLWQARTFKGQSGHDVLTPLMIGERAIIVNRGWVPIDATGPPVVEAAPPSGVISVSGIVRKGIRQGRFGPTDPKEGELDRISQVDLPRLQRQIDVELYPFYMQTVSELPERNLALPHARPVPISDPGRHFGYAIQWFVFATVVVTGYPILLMRTARTARSKEYKLQVDSPDPP